MAVCKPFTSESGKSLLSPHESHVNNDGILQPKCDTSETASHDDGGERRKKSTISKDDLNDVEGVSENQIEEIEALFERLQAEANSDHKSLLKVFLTRDMLDRLKDRKTRLGGGLADCIRSGCEHLDSLVGLYATDQQSYDIFSELFDKCIRCYHKVPDESEISHPDVFFGDISHFEDLDSSKNYVISTRIRVGRALEGYPFPPLLSLQSRREIETNIVKALDSLDGDIKGIYYPIDSMDDEQRDELVQQHFLFRPDSRFRRSVGGYNNWPDARGIFFNEDKTLMAWVNEGDHLRVISMEKGGNVKSVYNRLTRAVQTLGKKLQFLQSKRLGYLAFCPTNIGTSLRASVHMKIPYIAKSRHLLEDICARYYLQVRGVHGEHTESEGGVFDISNERRLGLTEFQAVSDMYRGAKEIIKLEKQLEDGNDQYRTFK